MGTSSSFPLPHLFLPTELFNEAAIVAKVEIMYGLQQSRLLFTNPLLIAQPVSSRDQSRVPAVTTFLSYLVSHWFHWISSVVEEQHYVLELTFTPDRGLLFLSSCIYLLNYSLWIYRMRYLPLWYSESIVSGQGLTSDKMLGKSLFVLCLPLSGSYWDDRMKFEDSVTV